MGGYYENWEEYQVKNNTFAGNTKKYNWKLCAIDNTNVSHKSEKSNVNLTGITHKNNNEVESLMITTVFPWAQREISNKMVHKQSFKSE